MTASDTATCLVTGANGFIGSRVASEFADAGYGVVGIDRSDGHSGVAGSVSHVRMDLPSPEFIDLLAAEQPDFIVHAAGPASVADSMLRPQGDFHGTVVILFALLDAVRSVSPRTRVVITSSAAVYGNPSALPIRENAQRAPVSPYGFHKCLAEDLLVEFAQLYGVRSCAARIFSAYGAGLRRQLLWDVCKKGTSAQQVTLFGTGKETRDFVHVSDVAAAIRTLAEKADMNGEAYNVASGEQSTITSIVDMLLTELSPDRSAHFSGEQRSGDPLYWQADISALSALGFSPKVQLADGVAEYARWFLAESVR